MYNKQEIHSHDCIWSCLPICLPFSSTSSCICSILSIADHFLSFNKSSTTCYTCHVQCCLVLDNCSLFSQKYYYKLLYIVPILWFNDIWFLYKSIPLSIMQLPGYILCWRFFFDASTLLPKNKILNSMISSILSFKSTIPVQLLLTYVLEATKSPRLLSLFFNRNIFYKLSNILAYINTYLVSLL